MQLVSGATMHIPDPPRSFVEGNIGRPNADQTVV